MSVFSAQSEAALATCHPDLQRVARAAIKVIDFAVTEGHRPKHKQDHAYLIGASKLKWPLSEHNLMPSRAFDFVPHPVDWDDRVRFAYVAGVIIGVGAQLGVSLRWGGDWDKDGQVKDESFSDMPHIELCQPKEPP